MAVASLGGGYCQINPKPFSHPSIWTSRRGEEPPDPLLWVGPGGGGPRVTPGMRPCPWGGPAGGAVPTGRQSRAPGLPALAWGGPQWGGGGKGGCGLFDFNFIAEQLIHGRLSPPVTPVMTFHHDEKWSDTAHYSCRSLSPRGGGGPPPPPDSERWPPLITPRPPSIPISRREGRARPYWAVLGHTGAGQSRSPPSISRAGPATPTTRHALATPPQAGHWLLGSLWSRPLLPCSCSLVWLCYGSAPPPRAGCAVGQGGPIAAGARWTVCPLRGWPWGTGASTPRGGGGVPAL